MKFKKTAALIMSLAMVGSFGYGQFIQGGHAVETVSAMETVPSNMFCTIKERTFEIEEGGTITVNDLVKHGLKIHFSYVVNYDLETDENYGNTHYLSDELYPGECEIIIPEISSEDSYKVKVIYHLDKSKWSRFPNGDKLEDEFYIDVFFKNDSYNAEIDDAYYKTYYDAADDCMYTWGSLRNIEFAENIIEASIPNRIRGTKIKELLERSVNCEYIESVIIPDGIISINEDAFYFTDSLKYITLPQNIQNISSLGADPETTAIRGYIGSFAEKYAEKNGYRFEGIGDINGDGSFNSADLLKMAAYMYGISELDEGTMYRADCNLDSSVNIVDFIMLKNSIIEPKMTSLGAPTKSALAVPDLKNAKRSTEKINADGYTNFASETAGTILLETEDKNGAENTVYSPLSIYMALSMAAECAGTQTQQEFLDALGTESIDDLRNENKALFGSLYFDDYNAYLKIANSLWLNDKYIFEQDTLDNIAENYYAVSFAKDFFSPETPDEISNWISLNTSGKFQPTITIDYPALEIMKIINTVTFKEKWSSSFGKASPDTFHLKNGTDIECDFLHRKSEEPVNNIGFADNYMKYSLEMNDSYRMTFILPDEDTSIDDIVGNKDAMHDIFANENIEYARRGIIFSVPKFDVASNFELSDAAKKIGIKLAFDKDNADFNSVVNYEKNDMPGAYLSAIDHEAKVVIDEDGCEAAAYTVISMTNSECAPQYDEPVRFELNRPFFYYISDTNGTPVFSGIINDPLGK